VGGLRRQYGIVYRRDYGQCLFLHNSKPNLRTAARSGQKHYMNTNPSPDLPEEFTIEYMDERHATIRTARIRNASGCLKTPSIQTGGVQRSVKHAMASYGSRQCPCPKQAHRCSRNAICAYGANSSRETSGPIPIITANVSCFAESQEAIAVHGTGRFSSCKI
jgi:hypothetical protein